MSMTRERGADFSMRKNERWRLSRGADEGHIQYGAYSIDAIRYTCGRTWWSRDDQVLARRRSQLLQQLKPGARQNPEATKMTGSIDGYRRL